ncbi:DUF5926 family protein [Promicromonospora thailandica]|uniref:DUF5926 domain-containing protein n=1 Tax=Promicromonospora thailandica TaxID=765201 RepID=A0A9X2G4Y1_9MICO|nr:DUF5926 family protein [Promicromonospora thailandica]MCP2263364.1 hypothetical protein [Promicromonospora thailandica]BFF19484.1 DUF5926 family protein [Promicromonospora thailandica]
MAKNPSSDFVLRPFEGLPGETDWVAMREIVPSATATARTTAEYGARDVTVVTLLPGAWTALHRADGTVLLAVQGIVGSGDVSRDLAAALLEALELEPGTAVESGALPGEGPRLQDVLDLTVPFEVTVHDSFDYWLDPSADLTPELKQNLEDAADGAIPTVKVSSVESAYWCSMSREFLRWARPEPEDDVIDAISRLHAKRESGLAGGRFVGAFRASGLVVPVWELPRGTQAEDLEAPVAELGEKLAKALSIKEPLDANERRARAGIVSRQVTLR